MGPSVRTRRKFVPVSMLSGIVVNVKIKDTANSKPE